MLETLTEGTRFIGGAVQALSPVQTASVREALIGAVLILVLRLRPQGLLPETPRVVKLDLEG